MNLREVPPNVGTATTEGVNDAYEALVSDEESARELAELLQSRPREVIRRSIRLNPYQRAALVEMNDAELQELISPVIKALGEPDPLAVRFQFREMIETQSPVKIKCEIEW